MRWWWRSTSMTNHCASRFPASASATARSSPGRGRRLPQSYRKPRSNPTGGSSSRQLLEGERILRPVVKLLYHCAKVGSDIGSVGGVGEQRHRRTHLQVVRRAEDVVG